MAGKTEYKNAWTRSHNDRIQLNVPTDFGARIREAAKASGQSIIAYISQAIQERMERDGFTPDASKEPPKGNS